MLFRHPEILTIKCDRTVSNRPPLGMLHRSLLLEHFELVPEVLAT